MAGRKQEKQLKGGGERKGESHPKQRFPSKGNEWPFNEAQISSV